MADFAKAILTVLVHEGGFCNNVHDPGGATNYGISLYWLKHLGELNHDCLLEADVNHDGRIDIADIKALTKETATAFYKAHWWDYYGYSRIVADIVATKVFDSAVNMGGVQAHKLLQRAIFACRIPCVVDGIFGKNTLAALNSADPAVLLPEFKRNLASFYIDLTVSKPTLREFLDGWIRRAAS